MISWGAAGHFTLFGLSSLPGTRGFAYGDPQYFGRS
jgi:hypothetical protein